MSSKKLSTAAHSISKATSPASCLVNIDNMNNHVKNVEYAIRGEINTKAMSLSKQLKSRSGTLPFEKIYQCNIGNPQVLEQKPLSFVRQVTSLMLNPDILDIVPKGTFPEDVIARAKKHMKSTPSMGAYTESKGLPSVRDEICEFLEKRDGVKGDPNTLFLTNGASEAAKLFLSCIMRSKDAGYNDGLMAPIPQYPIYSALTSMYNGTLIPYFLDEDKDWGLNAGAIEKSLDDAATQGVTVRAIVVINPGNPTGQILGKDNIQEIIDICRKKELCLIADEVYQENVYRKDAEFVSFRKAAYEMNAFDTSSGQPSLQLLSMHSTSKGFIGECGLRGGYMELLGFPEDVSAMIYKISSLALCSNTIGQVAMGCMVNPPAEGDESYTTYITEKNNILDSLKRRATKLNDALNQLEGVNCNQASGAMYCFPNIVLPQGAYEAALEKGKTPDEMYCMELLENTGIVTVPGKGFGQAEGTLHIRFTILPPEKDMDMIVERITKFHENFLKKYA